MESFYVPDGDGFVATELTRGPWDPGHQHAGPPSALLARELERHPSDKPVQVARIAFDILRPIPIASVTVTSRIVRPGRSVELVEAVLAAAEGPVQRASAWRIRTREVDIPAGLPRPAAPPGPEAGVEEPFFPTGVEHGYHTAMDWRFVSGAFLEPGPATVWMRPRVALVAGEDYTPLQRVLVAADSGNGVSATLDLRRHLFINVDLVVTLHRMPAGEWVGLDAITLPERNGVGMTDTALFDEDGRIGRVTQALLVGAR